jgi:hypothetical protein
VFLSAAVLAFALGGCGNDDKVVTGGGGAIAILPTTPQNTLLLMVEAYVGRDSVATEGIYDVAYEGTSTDLASPTPAVYNLTWFDEKHHVAVLKNNPNIANISVQLGSQTAWRRLPPEAGDPQDWAVLQIDRANIQITDVSSGFLYQAQNNKMLYTFIPTVAAPGDTTWKIVRWTEVRN